MPTDNINRKIGINNGITAFVGATWNVGQLALFVSIVTLLLYV